MVLFRGRCSFEQYIISKPTKHNLKIWALSESSSKYASYMEASCGSKGTIQPEKTKVVRVFDCHCSNLLRTIGIQLLARNITLVRRTRKNK